MEILPYMRETSRSLLTYGQKTLAERTEKNEK